MEKTTPSNQKIRANKNTKNKKTTKQPLKVVYIANPIKFTASASEFRALVQELTGQDATDTPPESPAGGAAADSGGEAADAGKLAARNNVHAEEVQKGSDPFSDSGSYSDVFVSPHHEMMESYNGIVDSNELLNVFKNLGAM